MMITTERLIIRPAVEADAELIYRLWTDPRVMTYVGFPYGLKITLEEVKKDIQRSAAEELKQLLIAELLSTGESIGQCHFGVPDEQGFVETDIKLLPEYWGNKYGVEIKRALVAYIFAHTHAVAVQATPNVENIASVRMQEAVGGVRIAEGVFEFPEAMKDFTHPVHHYVYRVYRQDFLKQEPQ